MSRMDGKKTHTHTYAIGSVPSLSGHAIAYRWRLLRRVRRHRTSKPQGSSERVLPWQVTMDQLICASISHIHYWCEAGMAKVSRPPTEIKARASLTLILLRSRPIFSREVILSSTKLKSRYPVVVANNQSKRKTDGYKRVQVPSYCIAASLLIFVRSVLSDLCHDIKVSSRLYGWSI